MLFSSKKTSAWEGLTFLCVQYNQLWFLLIQYARQECDPPETTVERNELITLSYMILVNWLLDCSFVISNNKNNYFLYEFLTNVHIPNWLLKLSLKNA